MCKFSVLLLAAATFAAQPTIYRDAYGVPHIYGKTDADAAFGLMYVQAEDNFWQLEEDYIRILGRAAELYGPSALSGDILTRAWESERSLPQWRGGEFRKWLKSREKPAAEI